MVTRLNRGLVHNRGAYLIGAPEATQGLLRPSKVPTVSKTPINRMSAKALETTISHVDLAWLVSLLSHMC